MEIHSEELLENTPHFIKGQTEQECLDSAEAGLNVGMDSNIGEFLKCSNLTKAEKDVLDLVLETGGLVSDLLLAANDLFNPLQGCYSFNLVRVIKCTIDWLENTFSDVRKAFHEMSTFTTNVTALVKDIKSQIDYCKDHSNQTALLHTQNSLHYINECIIKKKNVQVNL